jgi:hypothetical protein
VTEQYWATAILHRFHDCAEAVRATRKQEDGVRTIHQLRTRPGKHKLPVFWLLARERKGPGILGGETQDRHQGGEHKRLPPEVGIAHWDTKVHLTSPGITEDVLMVDSFHKLVCCVDVRRDED